MTHIATIIASQIPVSKWHQVIGESAVADAILDRLVHNAHRLELSGELMRKKSILEKFFIFERGNLIGIHIFRLKIKGLPDDWTGVEVMTFM